MNSMKLYQMNREGSRFTVLHFQLIPFVGARLMSKRTVNSLEEARATIPKDDEYVCIPRDAEDHPNIIETWKPRWMVENPPPKYDDNNRRTS